jgi:hypothetical protein
MPSAFAAACRHSAPSNPPSGAVSSSRVVLHGHALAAATVMLRGLLPEYTPIGAPGSGPRPLGLENLWVPLTGDSSMRLGTASSMAPAAAREPSNRGRPITSHIHSAVIPAYSTPAPPLYTRSCLLLRVLESTDAEPTLPVCAPQPSCLTASLAETMTCRYPKARIARGKLLAKRH